MVPHRPSGSFPGAPAGSRKSGSILFPLVHSFEGVKARVLAKLEARLDPVASKRMPASLLRHSLRQQVEQIAEQEGRALAKPDRDKLIEEALAELLGYGPLEELFLDPTVREVMVTGPNAVIARRDGGTWTPTNVRFRDEDHFRTALDRLATHADPVGNVTTSVNLFDLSLPNGFRAVGVVPPPALEQSAMVSFIRVEAYVALPPPPQPVIAPAGANPTGSVPPAAPRPAPGSVTASPRPGSGLIAAPGPRSGVTETDPLARHRKRLIDRLVLKLANLGVYDVQRLDIGEFRRVVAAYVAEYVRTENIYLSDTDQGRLQLEILAALRP